MLSCPFSGIHLINILQVTQSTLECIFSRNSALSYAFTILNSTESGREYLKVAFLPPPPNLSFKKELYCNYIFASLQIKVFYPGKI